MTSDPAANVITAALLPVNAARATTFDFTCIFDVTGNDGFDDDNRDESTHPDTDPAVTFVHAPCVATADT
ncbi:hypothetical protein, partial [Streptomyces sp. GbtcB7]|uniref:hypothetical protein n=1 Tax=Streptomyces sp. GbtcB7 TaxID=2824752 RepID=UPI0020C5B391